MPFYILPPRTDSAAANMADDLLMLERFPDPEAIRFRHYSWLNPAFTFGYSQKYDWARKIVGPDSIELCRRATGGGLVDHRNDWTYGLVIPEGHELFREPVQTVYRTIHKSLRTAFELLGFSVTMAIADISENSSGTPRPFEAPTLCFDTAEPADLITRDGCLKVAGAALKRNRHGLLLQGSIEKSLAPAGMRWDLLQVQFATEIAISLKSTGDLRKFDFPKVNSSSRVNESARFASSKWNQRR